MNFVPSQQVPASTDKSGAISNNLPSTGKELALVAGVGSLAILGGGAILLTTTVMPYQSLGLLAVAGVLGTYGVLPEDEPKEDA